MPISLRHAAVVALVATAPAAASTSRPFTVHDLVAMERVSDPRVSPDGTLVAYQLRTTDLAANAGRTDVWVVPTAGGEPRRLTADPASDTQPRWAPDGASLFVLSDRSGSSQVWRVPLAGGEARQATDLPLDVTSFAVSPDGRRLAVTLDVWLDCPDLACSVERLAAVAASPATGHLYDRLFVRHWDTWKDGRRGHLFVVPLAGGDGEPVDVSRGLVADVPTRPFGGPEDYTFSPDGRWLVFSAREAGDGEPWSTDFDLYATPVDGSAPPRVLTGENPAWDAQPVFSPDGETLAWRAMAVPGYEADRFRIAVMAFPDGERRVLTEEWDRSPDTIVFAPDGATIWATAADLGNVSLFAVDAASGEVRRVLEEGHVRSPQPLQGGGVVIARDTLTRPVELERLAPDGSLAPLTSVTAERLAALEMGKAEQMTFAGWNDETVHAWVVEPAGRREGERYPLAFIIHGGPQGSSANDFHYRWNPQTYAGAGYAVVMVDFHGSTGYGQAFTDSIRDDWGGKPLVDLQRGLAAALARYPWIDGDRACALGASYGGYMVNWIAGAWPDAFRCLVNHDGLFDQRMMYYATEELWFPEREHLGTYWQNPEAYEKHNPLHHVEKWKTPMLVVHGALDYRVPETQGIATFTALQRRGIPSMFLHFPDEDHWVLSPHNSIQWHDTVLAWLDRWLAGGPGPAAGAVGAAVAPPEGGA